MTKRTIATGWLVLLLAGPAAAGQATNDMPMGKPSEPAAGKGTLAAGQTRAVHEGVGTVKDVDPAKGTVTLQHEPIPTLNWSAMTMSFAAADKKLLQRVKPGDKVHFELEESRTKKGTYVVTGLKP